jgi:hypothetical protein
MTLLRVDTNHILDDLKNLPQWVPWRAGLCSFETLAEEVSGNE